MAAPRIDTVRTTANQLIHHTAQALEHIDDLHTLGWFRHADHRARERVGGGDPTAVGLDLDNHGDPTYRQAYTDLATALDRAGRIVETAVANALAQFDAGQIQTRRDTTADATSTEVVAALGRQAKRRATGEPGSVATIVQPLPTNARKLLQIEKLQTELDTLRSAVHKTHDDMRKAGLRPDRSRFTPLELTAWQTATGTTPRRRKRR